MRRSAHGTTRHGRIGLSLLLVLAPAGGTAAAPEGYVPLAAVAKRHALRIVRDDATGVSVCEGKGLRVTASAGMAVILVNGRGFPLERPVLEEDGEMLVPGEAVKAIEARAPKDAPPPPAAAPSPISARPAGPVRPLPRPFTIVLDAGHGGMHTGGKGRSGLMEKTVNLDVALRLQRRLAAAGIRVVMTRTADVAFSEDRNEDLHRRFEICNRSYPDLFLSVHSNWSENSSARGFEIYVRRERTADRREKAGEAVDYPIPAERVGGIPLRDPAVERILSDLVVDRSAEGSRLLAREIEERFRRSLSTENRGLKEQDFQVIRWSNCPAVLVELEFLSNPRGERELGSPSHREKLAELLTESVRSFRSRWAP